MKITVPPLELDEFEGFTKEKDIFGFKQYAENFTNLISNTDDPLVVGFTGEWGTGKTTFIKMWQGMLKHDKQVPSIYFDAFQNDFHSDAFLALAGELNNTFIEKDKRTKKAFKNKAKGVAKIMGMAGLDIGLRLLTSGLMNSSLFNEADTPEKVANAIKKSADKIFENQLDTLVEEKAAFDSFKKYLESKTSTLFPDKKLIFIIDELDRCKPTFALDLLEQIKHVFSVQNIVFVLVMNQRQMQQVIQSRYGGNTDNASLYLQKFINLWAGLPKTFPASSDQHEYQKRYFKHCLDKMGHRSDNRNSPAINIFNKLIEHYDMSFRDIERALTNFAILDNALSSEIESFRVLCVFVSVIKDRFPVVYHKLLINRITYDELIREIYLENFIKMDDDDHLISNKTDFQWLLEYTLASEKEASKMQSDHDKNSLYYGAESRDSLPTILNWINNFSR